jgi:UV excision repair protein RAD23
MQVTVKTLQQTKHTLDITPTETIVDLKNRLTEILLGKPTWDRQKLIHSGRVLVNEMTVETAGIKEGDFMVVMVAPPTVKTEKKEVERKLASKDEPKKEVKETPTTKSVNNPLLSGDDFEVAVQQMVSMGFDKESVLAAMRASYNNPDRAVEYLFNGIPEGAEVEEGSDHHQVNHEDGDNPLEFLRNDPQFLQLRTAIQQNPSLLPPLIEQIGQANPELFALLDQHKEAFIELLNEGASSDVEGEDAENEPLEGGQQHQRQPPAVTIQVNEQEQEALKRLEQLGFPRARVIEAYFACDKNEELAANFLFENPE